MTCTWYFATIPARNISKLTPNTTRRFLARGILVNFEISLAVLLPNTTTGHATCITYTNATSEREVRVTNDASFLPGQLSPWTAIYSGCIYLPQVPEVN